MAKEREIERWITVNGARVPIFAGESVADAVKGFKERIGKRNSNQPMTQKGKEQTKKEYTNARNAAHNAKSDKQEKANARFEQAKQKYSESKQKQGIKSATFTAPSDRDTANKTNDEFMRRENERYEKEHGKGTYQKEETQKQQKVPSNPRDRVNDLAKRMENAKTEQEREAVRNDMDKAWKDIDHDKKLDDREKNYLESKLRDIYSKSKAQENIKKNEDEKEKQIARNAEEKKQIEKADGQQTRIKNIIAGTQAAMEKAQKEGWTEEQKQAIVISQNQAIAAVNKQATEQEMRDFLKSKGKEKFVEELSGRTEKGYKAALQYVYDQHTLGKEQFAKKYGLDNSQLRSMEASQYDKYKSGYKYENAKTVNVNGNEYKVWSNDIYRGTFAEDKNGNVLPIKQNGYLSNEVSQRKAIANAFGEGSFRSKSGGHKNSNSGFKTASEWDRESAPKITYDKSKAKSYKIASGGLNRASQAAADTMGQSLFKNGRADIVIKEENARDTTYSLRDKYGNEVGTFLQTRTEKKGTGKLTLYGAKTASKQKTNKK